MNGLGTLPRGAPMYEAFYGFAQPPFTLAPDPKFLYLSETHDDAIRQLLQAIRRKAATSRGSSPNVLSAAVSDD